MTECLKSSKTLSSEWAGSSMTRTSTEMTNGISTGNLRGKSIIYHELHIMRVCLSVCLFVWLLVWFVGRQWANTLRASLTNDSFTSPRQASSAPKTTWQGSSNAIAAGSEKYTTSPQWLTASRMKRSNSWIFSLDRQSTASRRSRCGSASQRTCPGAEASKSSAS